MIGTVFGYQTILRHLSAPALDDLLQIRLGIVESLFILNISQDIGQDELPCGLDAPVEVDRADQSFERVGQNRLPVPSEISNGCPVRKRVHPAAESAGLIPESGQGQSAAAVRRKSAKADVPQAQSVRTVP